MLRTVVVLSSLTAASAALAGGLSVYDDFGLGYIDLSKWKTAPMCGGPPTGDCAREVAEHALRFAIREYGDTSRDTGATASANWIYFSNPQPINSIQMRVTVASYLSVACLTNPDPADPNFSFSGSFFNTGSGLPADDMSAVLEFDRLSSDPQPPNMVRVGGYIFSAQYLSNWADLGYVEVGEKATVTVSWEPTTHDFLLKIDRTKTLPLHAKVVLPYSQSDTRSPAAPYKQLVLQAITPNCTSADPASAMNLFVDNVKTGQ
jgi:hypothetical protein